MVVMLRPSVRQDGVMDTEWDPLSIEQVADRFSRFDGDWWIAGGHAIDCFVGWETRHHADIDVEMFRSDRDALFDVFPGWDMFTASGGGLTPWIRGSAIAPHVFGIWARPASDAPWAVEVMLADGDHTTWRFRRDPRISLERGRLVRWTPAGIPYCTPEVQLLYKSKQARPKDDVDLARVLHHMTTDQRRWLIDAIERADGAHPWVHVLEMANQRHHD